MASNKTAFIQTLPVELLHRILDSLDAEISISIIQVDVGVTKYVYGQSIKHPHPYPTYLNEIVKRNPCSAMYFTKILTFP